MFPIEPEVAGARITLVGSFNPLIFSPAWMARSELIDGPLADAAEIKVIHGDISAINFDWFTMRVDKQNFAISTNAAPYIRLADLTSRMFGSVLMHTPVWSVGINQMAHFSVGTADVRNKIGRALAPVEPWGEWGRELNEQTGEFTSGMSTLVMERLKSDMKAPFGGVTSATVQPSRKIKNGTGIYVSVTDSYRLETGDKTIGCSEIISKLVSSFEISMAAAERIITQIMSLKEKYS